MLQCRSAAARQRRTLSLSGSNVVWRRAGGCFCQHILGSHYFTLSVGVYAHGLADFTAAIIALFRRHMQQPVLQLLLL